MSLINYHQNTTRELIALKDNVRNLIEHWGEDGRYKEAVLKNMIQRFLPEKYIIATGFVIKPTNARGEHKPSKQIDLLIYDNESPVIFKEGDFVILTPDGVRAIIEVKANLQNQNVTQVVNQANANGKFIFDGKEDKSQLFFNGIFSFESAGLNTDLFARQITEANALSERNRNYKKFKVNHISLNENWFVKYWPDEDLPHSVYDIQNLSFSFFISNLIDFLASSSVRKNNFIWFANDKELRRIHQF